MTTTERLAAVQSQMATAPSMAVLKLLLATERLLVAQLRREQSR